MWTEEQRKKFSESRKGVNNPFYGKTHSTIHRKKIAEVHTGKNNKLWKGDEVSYRNLHKWIRRNFPIPEKCEMCNEVKKLDLANITGIYNRDCKNWKWYCRKCHLLSDGRLFKNLKQFNII